ncbi:MAG: DUF1566 domain-containing protein [Campylobacterota bacterium]|nr:DUF1566 domain-containing protein [Campylobacterota bacterium]
MKTMIAMLISATLLFAFDLRKSGDTVVDKTHKLLWQDHPHNTKVILTHPHAIEYCEKLKQGGFMNWRLPSVEEYEYIIDKSRVKEEIMINKVFYHIVQDDYWTSDRTWIRNFGRYAYYVFFKSGAVYYQNRTYPKYVRCVRDMK